MRGRRIEPPLEHVAGDTDGDRYLTVFLALGVRPDVDQNGAGSRGPVFLSRRQANQVSPGVREEILDGANQSGGALSQ